MQKFFRSFSPYLVGGCVSATWIGYYKYRGDWEEYRRKLWTLQQYNGEVEPSLRLLKLLDKVKCDCNVEENVPIRLFVSNVEANYVGRLNSWTTQPPAIGVLFTYNYPNVDELPSELIAGEISPFTGQSSYDLKRESQLQKFLIASEKEISFLLARQLFYLKSYASEVLFAMRTIFVVLFYISATLLNRRVHNLRLLCILYAFLGGACYLLYYIFKSSYLGRLDFNVDRKAVELGGEYASGALAYYERLVQFNVQLRDLQPSEGSKQFSPVGNEAEPSCGYYGSFTRLHHIKQLISKD